MSDCVLLGQVLSGSTHEPSAHSSAHRRALSESSQSAGEPGWYACARVDPRTGEALGTVSSLLNVQVVPAGFFPDWRLREAGFRKHGVMWTGTGVLLEVW